MGNKPRRTCAACGHVFKDRGPALQERCPQCTALCVRKPAPAPQPKKASKAAAAEAFLSALDAATTLVSEAGAPLAAALHALAASPLVALDAEGVALSRTGQLTLLQAATAERVFVFDCLALGAAAFDAKPPAADGVETPSLRELLEDAQRTKLCWDVRRDSDALFHQHGVALRGVLDVQLAAVAVRRAAGETVTALPGVPVTAAKFLDKARVVPALRCSFL
jgi:exonuclease 3'-5' domain-containing protein 1